MPRRPRLTKREFVELTSAIASSSSKTDAVLAGIPATGEIETTTGMQLSRHKLQIEVDHLKSLGLSDDLIRQAVDGAPVSASEKEMAKTAKRMRLDDEAWVKRYMANNFAERREMLPLNLILSAEVVA
jgi:hypothetical protein